MAFKLTNAEDKQKSDIEADLEQAVGVIEDAKTELESEIEKLITDFNETHIAAFNEKLETARGWVEDIHRERSEDYDQKSERWTEGDRGQAAYDWLQTWESAVGELDAMTDVEVPQLDITIPDAANVVQQLEGEPYQ